MKLKPSAVSFVLITATLSIGSFAAKRPELKDSAKDLEACATHLTELKFKQRGFEKVNVTHVELAEEGNEIQGLDLIEIYNQTRDKPTMLFFHFEASLPDDGIQTEGSIAVFAQKYGDHVDCKAVNGPTYYPRLRSFVAKDKIRHFEID